MTMYWMGKNFGKKGSTTTALQPFYGSLDFLRDPGKPVPER